MKFPGIPYSRLSLEAISSIADKSKTTIENNHPDDPLLASSLNGLTEPIHQATLAIGRDRKQALSAQISAADEMRDRCFIGITRRIDAELYNDWNENQKHAAERLLAIIERHGRQLYAQSYLVQSELLKSVFADLDTDEAKADLTTISLTDWVAHLKNCEANFLNLTQQRNELESAKVIPTKKEAKKPLADALSVLLQGLEFLSNTQPDAYETTAKVVVATIERTLSSER